MDERTRNLFFGFAGGVGAAIVLPFAAPVLGEILRPVLKVVLKESMLAFEHARTGLSRASEVFEDLLAEVRAEVETELKEEAEREAGEVRVAPAEPERKAVGPLKPRTNPKIVS